MAHLADLIQLGFMNKIATGYPILDILLCMLIPWLINKVSEWSSKGDISISKFTQWFTCCCARTIEREIRYIKITNDAGAVYDTSNRYMMQLQDAILRYINKHDYIKDGRLKDGLISVDIDNNDVILQPASYKWINLKNGVALKIYRYEDKTDNYVFNSIIFALKSKHDIVDDFIKICYNEYIENRYVANKSCRYMFVPYFKPEGIITFDKHKLEDNKTFDLIFHPQIKEVTKLLDDFMNKRGRFAIKGFPYKLGFLLHGKPGTGKTSFIKALRMYTNRHIINISLSKIETNQQLNDLMFNTKLMPRHDDTEFHITFDNVIYVLEDIDVLSNIVRSRDSKAASNNNDTEDNNDSDNDDSNKGSKRSSKKKNDVLDKLNLAGLLNVLDGILETPGRIVVMTTNHPEHLDPALIRPGRINKTIHMGNIDTDSALKMIEYYVGKLDDKQRQFIMNKFPQDKITPAYLESKCMDFTDIKSVINWIKTL